LLSNIGVNSHVQEFKFEPLCLSPLPTSTRTTADLCRYACANETCLTRVSTCISASASPIEGFLGLMAEIQEEMAQTTQDLRDEAGIVELLKH
jgi:hypothetical protein